MGKDKRRGTSIGKSLLFVIIFLGLFSGFSCHSVLAETIENSGQEEYEKIMEEQAKAGEVGEIENKINQYSGAGIKELMPGFDPKRFITGASKGKFKWSIAEVFNRGLAYLFKEVYINAGILIKLVILAIFCAIIKNLQASFLNESVGEVAFFACYLILVSVMILSLNTVLDLSNTILDQMIQFMQATVPILITLLVSGGNLTSAGIFQPVLIMMVELGATFIRNTFLPLITLSLILTIIDNMSDRVKVTKLAHFFKQITLWGLGIILTIFIGIITLQGTLGAVVDGVTGKTAKFAIGAMVPVVGKYLADAADTVVSCTLLIKNAAGVGVMIGVIGICVLPLLKIFAMIVLYRITCVLVEPIADKRITNCINEMANTLTYILGISASVAFMFLISLTAIIGASNVSSMIR